MKMEQRNCTISGYRASEEMSDTSSIGNALQNVPLLIYEFLWQSDLILSRDFFLFPKQILSVRSKHFETVLRQH